MKISSLCLVSLLPLMVAGSASAAESTSSLQSVEQAARDWVKVRAETSRLDNEWRAERGLLESTVAGLTERAATVEERRENAKTRSADQRAEIESLKIRMNRETAEIQTADTRLQQVAARLVQLRPALPPRLSEALELPYRSLTSSDTGEKMQYALTVLNRCAQFNRVISCGEEVVTVDGTARSLEVIYWGLSQAYALDRSANKAWLGAPSSGRWQWEPLDGAAREVGRLIDIYHDKADPEFVSVPARVSHLGR